VASTRSTFYVILGGKKQQATSAYWDRRSGSCRHIPQDAVGIWERGSSAVEPRYLWNNLLLSTES